MNAARAQRQHRERDAAPASGAARNRVYRERRRCGLRIVPVEVGEELVSGLIRRGLLAPNDIDNAVALALALGMLLEGIIEMGGEKFAGRVTGRSKPRLVSAQR